MKCDPISGPADWGEGLLRGEACQLVVVVDGEDCQLEEEVGSQGGGREGGGRERGAVDTGMLCASPHLQTNILSSSSFPFKVEFSDAVTTLVC